MTLGDRTRSSDWTAIAGGTPGAVGMTAELISWCAVASLLAVDALLFARAGVGGFTTRLAGDAVLGSWSLALLLLGATRVVRAWLPDSRQNGPAAVDLLGSAALALLALFLSMRAVSWLAPACVWLTWIVGEELWYRQWLRGEGRGWLSRGGRVSPAADETQSRPMPPDEEVLDEESGGDGDEVLLADDVDQQLTYSRSESGARRVHGLVRIRLAPRQRVAAAHVAFCPPFARAPTVVAHTLSGEGVDLRATHEACFGVRWEAHRSMKTSQAAADVVVYFEAEEPTPPSPAS